MKMVNIEVTIASHKCPKYHEKFASWKWSIVAVTIQQVTSSCALVNWKFGRLLLKESVHVGSAPHYSLAAAAAVHHQPLLLFLLPLPSPEDLGEVYREDPAEEDDVHHNDHGKPDASNSEDGEGDAVPVDGEPAGHPAEKEDPKEEKGGNVKKRVCAISWRAFRLPGDDEELPGVQKHWVHLNHEAETAVSNILSESRKIISIPLSYNWAFRSSTLCWLQCQGKWSPWSGALTTHRSTASWEGKI